MASDAAVRVLGLALVVAAFALPAVTAAQQVTPRSAIFTCTGHDGKKITSDRPIAECASRDQRELNADGSVRRIVPPTPTAEERAEMEAREREVSAERVARNDAVRRDRNLMQRFPNEAAHRKAREKALDDIRASVKNTEARVALLNTERKPLLDEKEFYVGKALPGKLKLALDANDASLEAQKALVQNQQIEIGRINALFDAELARLKKLWAGALPGSLGPVPGPQAAASSGSRASVQ